jgi:hypothetical protein
LPPLQTQVVSLLILALPVASWSWTVAHEELFREFRGWCGHRCKTARSWIGRKAFYPFTCAFCFSHYVTAILLLITGFRLLYADWRGYLVAGFAVVWVANVYVSLFTLLRVKIGNEQEQ